MDLALQGDDGQWAGGACFPARPYEAEEGPPGYGTGVDGVVWSK